MPAPKLDDLPPLARARAMELERPYRPGQKLRGILIGIVIVSAVAAVFLLRMPASTPRAHSAAQAATPGVVYQNLRVAPQAPPPPSEERAK